MLKVTYTDTGLCLEYCPTPLNLLLSDRVCTYAHAQRSMTVQPIRASIPLLATLIDRQLGEQLQTLELTRCDRDWWEITLSGLWITEGPNPDIGIFMAEFDPRLEQRLWRLWQLSQSSRGISAMGMF